MASSSSFSRGKWKAISAIRNVDPSGWISDEGTRERLEKKVDVLYQNKVKNDSTTEDSNERSTEEDYRQMSNSE
ncbi:hypothetical protein LR48_Vigan347s003200 [Vigna angularis]|uniref:Uncharacterized protein n=1 Tax=Phaseolus angularis TaxID=3914 RepID=A0A0L9T8T2_PHAAN|nr:hypothetical protein LR48_Vigan347s003200 [Vigna angularis]